jgi:hypothetical protein
MSTFATRVLLAAGAAAMLALSLAAQTTIVAVARSAPTPPWTKGILPISPESYYNAIDCGKQGGADPPCVFWDTGLCKNTDFALTMYTPYKSVAYEVWRVVSQKQPAPQPSYPEAQKTNVTIAVAPVKGSTNAFTGLTVKRGGAAVAPIDKSVSAVGGRYTFMPSAFAATGPLTLELAGKSRTLTCTISRAVLAQFR